MAERTVTITIVAEERISFSIKLESVVQRPSPVEHAAAQSRRKPPKIATASSCCR